MTRSTTFLTLGIAGLSVVATGVGIFSRFGSGEYEYSSIRGRTIRIYGRGIYQHMSSDVAVQGIAQDYVTLFIGVPLLLISLFIYRKGSVKGKFLLAGVLGYFLVTYLFYLAMGMYNFLFPVYVLLTGMSFFAFATLVLSFDLNTIEKKFEPGLPRKAVGIFLIINSILIALLWLSVVVPPFLNGTIYPVAVEHYTTLIVQGLDLSILLPAAFLSGLWILKRRAVGFLLAPVYLMFLSILMTALSAKIIGMSLVGASAGPAIVIIPIINAFAVLLTLQTFRNMRADQAALP